MVPQRDLVLDLVRVRGDLLEIDLVAVARDVERVADLQIHGLVFRRVSDAIFADELDAALRVGLVDAHDTGRHRHAESAVLFVLELVVHLHLVLDRRAGMLRVAVVVRLAVDDVALQHGNGGTRQHAHLFGLVVVDCRLAAERVQVVVGERFLRHRRRSGAVGRPHFLERHRLHHLADPIELACDELELRVSEGSAAAVDERHPAVEVGGLVVARHGQHVIGVPRQLAGEVRRLDAMAGGAAVVERPDESRPRVEIVGELREPHVIGVHAGDDLVADAPDRRVVVAQEPRGDVFLPAGAVGLDGAHQRDVASDVLPQQLVGLEQIVFVILLEHADARRLRQRSEVDGGGVDGGRDVHEPQIEASARKLQVADVADERDVGVVDGEREIDLVVERRGVLAGGLGDSGVGNGLAPEQGGAGHDQRKRTNSCAHERLLSRLRTEPVKNLAAGARRVGVDSELTPS